MTKEEIKQILLDMGVLKTPYYTYYFDEIKQKYCSVYEDVYSGYKYYDYYTDIDDFVLWIDSDCGGDLEKVWKCEY